MRNFTFLFIFACSFLQAQSVIFEEDFESTTSYSPPVGWQKIDLNNDNTSWFVLTENYFSPAMTHLNGRYETSFSWAANTGGITPDNLLVTSKITIPENAKDVTLNFNAGTGYDSARVKEHYAVYASTSSDAESIIATTPILEETLQVMGNHARSVDLSDYAGKDIYVAFRHYNCNDQWILAIDDIVVQSSNALSVQDVNLENITHYYDITSESLVLASTEVSFSSVSIFNILGQEVLQTQLSKSEEHIRLNTLNKGVYLAKIMTTSGQTKTIKFVKH
ncbi:choice-of-anchor J domain-containing protein [Formosa sp. A9]|uniref:choice-of-anchor J domain-containing protein n=1 Tax=Formosa sp. A9 TaxID=3442641 RepID=UPI003EB6D9B5